MKNHPSERLLIYEKRNCCMTSLIQLTDLNCLRQLKTGLQKGLDKVGTRQC